MQYPSSTLATIAKPLGIDLLFQLRCCCFSLCFCAFCIFIVYLWNLLSVYLRFCVFVSWSKPQRWVRCSCCWLIVFHPPPILCRHLRHQRSSTPIVCQQFSFVFWFWCAIMYSCCSTTCVKACFEIQQSTASATARRCSVVVVCIIVVVPGCAAYAAAAQI